MNKTHNEIQQEGWLEIFQYSSAELRWIKNLKKGNRVLYQAQWGDGHEYVVQFLGYHLCDVTQKLSIEIMMASEEKRYAYPYQIKSYQSHYRK